MAAFVREAAPQESRPIAYTPLILTRGEWSEFRPAAAALAPVLDLHRDQQSADYADQKAALERGREDELFIATHCIGEYEGRRHTWATWTRDVPTLLPRADVVNLQELSGAGVARRWEDLEAVLGPLPQEPGLEPPRYRTGAWPSRDALQRLKSEFSAPAWMPD